MHFVDTHCHLDDERYEGDLDAVLKRTRDLGVEEILIPAASPRTLGRAKEISDSDKNVYFACGLHPCDIDEEAQFRASLSHFVDSPKCKEFESAAWISL